MKKSVISKLRLFFEETYGQAITEYGAVLAFVSCLIGLLFAGPSGGIGFWLNWIGNWKLSSMLRALIGLSS